MSEEKSWLIENLKGVFVGSGSDGLSQPEVCETIIGLTSKPAKEINVLYIGTATYDLQGPMLRQTDTFRSAGCSIASLSVTDVCPDVQTMQAAVSSADVVIVSGGNTLFAVDRWTSIGLHDILRAGMNRGLVCAGGSAGAICWFDGGHSDSADPATYKDAMRKAADPNSKADESESKSLEKMPWEYIRIDGLGLLPGLVCPHHDMIQSNGLLRADDFDSMLLKHKGEKGLCIDHFAALIVEGDLYRVISITGKKGSVMDDNTYSGLREGKPGIWSKEVIDGKVVRKLVPSNGKLSELLCTATKIERDARVDKCRKENPQPST